MIAVTGSVGKTTTKTLCAAVLRAAFPTFCREGNFNSVIGMPLCVPGIGTDVRAAVLEMGMSARGEISALSRAACPDIAVITNIGSSHLESLGTRENIARAKLEVLDVGRNRLKDEGVEAMLGAFANHAASNLKRLVFADNEESQAVVLALCELVAEGRLPALCTVEWTAALSATLSLPFELLQALQRHAPRLVLPITTITCSCVGVA